MFRPEASALKGLTSAYGQPEARLPHSFNMSVSFAFESQDFCAREIFSCCHICLSFG